MTQELGLGKSGSRIWLAARDKRAQTNGAAYAMLTPWLVGFFCLTAIPMLVSLYLSFTDYSLLSPPEWVGLDNYLYMFGGDYRFWPALKVTVFYVFVSVPLSILIAIPIMLLIGNITGHTIILGVQRGQLVLLLLTLFVSTITFTSSRTNILQGLVHVLLFFAYILLLFQD